MIVPRNVAKLYSFSSSRRLPLAVCLWLVLAGLVAGPAADASAQKFQFSLDEFSTLNVNAPFDTTARVPLDRLKLGEYHTLPNFLTTDFRRERIGEEYFPGTFMRMIFRHPITSRFEFDEVRDGAFLYLVPRDLDAPGLVIELGFIDEIAEAERRRSSHEVWQETIVASINARRRGEGVRTSGINVPIPIPLPGVVESIIGRGEETNITISGRESITISGESRRVSPFIGVEGQQKQSLFPSLDMRQELDVRLQGQIGEKLNVQVDHSSQAIASDQNQIRLNYVGFEDDIIQRVELGNTSLTLPGSQLVSFSGSSQGLFGIKALAQVGPMDITMIASKEEGETSRATFNSRGGTIGQTERRIIRDIDFVKDTYFFLDAPDSINAFFGIDDKETSLEVFESVSDIERQTNPELVTFPGKAWVDSFGRGRNIRDARADIAARRPPPPFEDRNFKLLTFDEDYRYVLNAVDESIVGLEMIRSVAKTTVLAVRYVNVLGDTIGNLDNFTDTLALELIKPWDPRPTNQFGYTWQFMMRHIYNLGLSNIDEATLELEIEDRANRLDPSIPEGSEVPWIRVFGLDRTDVSGVGPPDSRVDLIRGLIDADRGILTFPILTPFNPPDDSVAVWTDGKFAFSPEYENIRRPEVYTDFLSRPEDFHSFRIIVRAASTTRTFNIDAFNITENSEIVKLDGRALVRNRDYTINYETGEVELQGTVLDELTPSSNITIDYEFKPFIGGASSTLLGFSSLLTLSQTSKFGTTWLFESKSSSTTRPRLGEEPSRAVVGDLNGNVSYHPSFLTNLVNKLPLVDTEARSTVNLAAEIAVSFPDPNTRGEAYIDDFEGVEDSDEFSLTRRAWNPASPPVLVDTTSATGFTALEPDSQETVLWYNIEPSFGVTRRDLNPELDERESTLIPSLDIEFVSAIVDTSRWAGIMTGFRGGGLDLSQGQFLEVWINDFKGGPTAPKRGGIIHFDLGLIDEDFFEPKVNVLDTEDKNRDGFTALTEDTGLDGVFNGDVGDDPDDDYFPSRINGRFDQINGTEGNLLLDTEDLDGSGQLDQSNSYFTFSLDLASEPITDVRKEFPNSNRFEENLHQNDSWRLYRIDLSEAQAVSEAGRPTLAQITHVRVWFDHIGDVINPGELRFQIVGFKVVGNRWEKDGIRAALTDSLLTGVDTLGTNVTLGVISNKTDPTRYSPPIGPSEQNDIFEKEQSLLVNYDNIPDGQSFRIRKRFPGNGLDWTLYRDLNFFTHTEEFNNGLEYYFQVAFDSLNFYEITIPMTQQFFSAGGWVRVLVDLADITDLKFETADSAGITTAIITDKADPNRRYVVHMKGLPNLFSVRFLYAGVRNRSGAEVSGELWLDDIFLGNRKRDIDFAQRATGSISFGNVVSVNGSWQRTGADFRSLRQKRGSGRDDESLSLNVKTSLQHFIPLLGFNIPVSASYRRITSLPKFVPNSDTEIRDEGIRDSLKTETTTRGFSTSLTRSGSRNPVLRYTFDKLRTNFSISQSRTRSPSSADTSLTMAGTLVYQINWTQRKTRLKLFKNTHFRWWLSSLNLRMNATRRTGQRFRNVGGQFVPDPETFDAALTNSGSATYIPFNSLSMNLRLNQQRDVRLPHKFLGIEVGVETRRDQT
ncbi:MAG: cell surface protein SprA, partial [Candidatus Krumholzibacteria bacterium]